MGTLNREWIQSRQGLSLNVLCVVVNLVRRKQENSSCEFSRRRKKYLSGAVEWNFQSTSKQHILVRLTRFFLLLLLYRIVAEAGCSIRSRILQSWTACDFLLAHIPPTTILNSCSLIAISHCNCSLHKLYASVAEFPYLNEIFYDRKCSDPEY